MLSPLVPRISVLGLPLEDDPTPIPSPGSTLDPNTVTPGVAGFVVTGLLIVAVLILIFDMVRRMRRLRYRVEAQEKIAAEEAAELAAERDATSEGMPIEGMADGSFDPGDDERGSRS